MGTAREQGLRFVGVMETDERHCKPDVALEKSRARTGGRNGGPDQVEPCTVHDQVEENLRLMDGICFIPLRRQEHEVGPMLKEIIRQASCGTDLRRTAWPRSGHCQRVGHQGC
jgi:hypothetical protein